METKLVITGKHKMGSFTYKIPSGIWKDETVEGSFDFYDNKNTPTCNFNLNVKDGNWMSVTISNEVISINGVNIDKMQDFITVVNAVYSQVKELYATETANTTV